MSEEEKKEYLKRLWSEFSFDEIIDAGFDNNKCSAMHLINAAGQLHPPKGGCLNKRD